MFVSMEKSRTCPISLGGLIIFALSANLYLHCIPKHFLHRAPPRGLRRERGNIPAVIFLSADSVERKQIFDSSGQCAAPAWCTETEQTCMMVYLIDLSHAFMLISIQRGNNQKWHPSFMASAEFYVFQNGKEAECGWKAAHRFTPNMSELLFLFFFSFHLVAWMWNVLHPC